MASNPLFTIPDFFCNFPMNFAMAALGLKEMGNLLWEVCPVGCLSLVLLKPKVVIAKFIGKRQKSLVLRKMCWTPCLFSS